MSTQSKNMAAPLAQPPLNRLPRGLLDFFGIKHGEWGPRTLSSQLVPTFDLLRWYLDTNALEIAADPPALAVNSGSTGISITNTSPVNLSNGVDLIVPQNEYWIFLEASVQTIFSAAAGQTARTGLRSISSAGQLFLWPMASGGYDASVAAVQQAGWSYLINPVFVPPGSTIAIQVWGAQVGAATIEFDGRFRLVRCLI